MACSSSSHGDGRGAGQPRDGVLATVVNATLLCWAVVVAVGFALAMVGRLTGPLLLAGVGLLVGFALWGSRRTKNNGFPEPGELRMWEVIWSVLAALGIGHLVWRGLFNAPEGWDTLGYHLPIVDAWLQAKSLTCA